MKRSHHHSQNFLRRPQLVKTLVGHSDLKKQDTVYDIGAGSGIISSVLAGTCKQVVAIELDPRMAAKLRSNTATLDNVKVITDDFLQLPEPVGPYKVFANIPFHLSSPIVRKLTEAENPPASIYLIVQKQFAVKLLIGEASPYTGLLGTMIAPWFTARIRYRLQRTDFWPHPAVDTVMVEIKRRKDALLPQKDMPTYHQFVQRCYSRQKYFAALPSPLAAAKRPSQLSAHEWIDLYTAYAQD